MSAEQAVNEHQTSRTPKTGVHATHYDRYDRFDEKRRAFEAWEAHIADIVEPARAATCRGRALEPDGHKAEKSVAKLECVPEGGQRSGCGFAKLPCVHPQIAECRMKPAIVVDLLDEAGKVFCDVLEGLEDHRVDRLDLQRLDEADSGGRG